MLDVEAEKQKINEEYKAQQEFYDFCGNQQLIRDLIEYQLTQVQKQNTAAALDAAKKSKQPLFQTILNELAHENKVIEQKTEILKEERKSKFVALKELLAEENIEDLRKDYIFKLDDVAQRVIQFNPELE
jgi:uncharacterized protein YhfF